MHILAIPATNSRSGINRQLLTYVARVFDSDLDGTVELVDIGDYEMPIYSPEREQATGGPPAEARQLFGRVGAADGVVISFAEHNGSYSAAWKNLYDWMSRIDQKVLQHKPTVLLAATPGPRAGAGVLASASEFLPHAGAQLVGTLGIGSFGETFETETGAITNTDIETRLRSLLRDLIAEMDARTAPHTKE